MDKLCGYAVDIVFASMHCAMHTIVFITKAPDPLQKNFGFKNNSAEIRLKQTH